MDERQVQAQPSGDPVKDRQRRQPKELTREERKSVAVEGPETLDGGHYGAPACLIAITSRWVKCRTVGLTGRRDSEALLIPASPFRKAPRGMLTLAAGSEDTARR